MIKRIAIYILFFIILAHAIPFIFWLTGLIGYLNLGNSYVAYINTPKHKHTEQYLEELNTRGFGEVVKRKGLRPIFIVEGNLNKRDRYEVSEDGIKEYYEILGIAYPMATYCLIIMDESILGKDKYIKTLWHEYLHRFYYDHVEPTNDLMTASNTEEVDKNTVDNYLKELKELYE